MARHFKIQKQVVHKKRKGVPKAEKEVIGALGRVIETLPNTEFLVELLDEAYGGHRLKARPAGKMRMNNIKVILGDYVAVELNPYDVEKGRLTFRFRSRDEAERRMNPSASADSSEETE